MVALHLLEGEFLLAVGTDVMLLFPYGELYVFGECAKIEIMLVSRQDVGNYAKGLLNVAISHEAGDFFLYSSDVKRLLMEGIVEICPIETFHNSLELLHAEIGGCPIQYVLEICPKVVGIWVVLMLRHIAYKCLWVTIACFVVSHPFKSFFEEVLTNGSINDQILAQAKGTAI